MSDTTEQTAGTATADEQPEGRPARPPRRDRAEDGGGRVDEGLTGEDALAARAADGQQLTDDETDALTAYFLGGTSAPGQSEDEYLTREVNLGSDAHPRWQTFTLRPVEWEEWQMAQQKGTIKRRGQDVVDPLLRASFTVAYATVSPDLGKLRQRIPAEWEDPDTHEMVKRPTDTAELLRVFFKRIPGGLIDIENEVMRASKIMPGETSVREVEAAGN